MVFGHEWTFQLVAWLAHCSNLEFVIRFNICLGKIRLALLLFFKSTKDLKHTWKCVEKKDRRKET